MTDVRIDKLPKWAQDHIDSLQRERDLAVRALNKYCDEQTKSAFFCDEWECTGENQGPSSKRRYFQGRRINAKWRGINLEVYLVESGDHQRLPGIELKFTSEIDHLGLVAIVPTSFNAIQLVSQDDMRRP